MNTYVLCEQRQQKQTCYSEHGKAQVAILNKKKKKELQSTTEMLEWERYSYPGKTTPTQYQLPNTYL